MNELEVRMRDVVLASLALKRALYQRDDAASTTPEGTDGPRTTIHVCQVCRRAAAGADAQVRHKSRCELAQLQRAQKALRAAWPELFAKKPLPEVPAASSARIHSNREPGASEVM